MFGIGGGGGFLGTGINKNASDPVSNALSNNPVSKGVSNLVQSGAGAIDQGLVGLDKTVGKVIPGGWGTVGMMAGSAMGLPTWAMTGLGALNGSGVLRKGGKFNLQGAMMGGAMAYGMSELGEYMRAAAPVDPSMLPISETLNPMTEALAKTASNIDPSILETMSAEQLKAAVPASYANAALTSADTSALNALTKSMEAGAGSGLQVAPPPSVASQFLSGNVGDAFNQIGTNISEGVSNLGTKVANTASDAYQSLGNFADKATNLDTYGNAIDRGMSNASQTGSGIKNLVGMGDITAKEAAALAAKSGVSPMMASAATLYGATGLAGLEEQRKFLDEQKATNAISQAEYDKAMAEITRSEDVARKAVAEHPFSTNPSRDVSIGDTYYGRTGANENLYARNNATLYAGGGAVGPEIGAAGLAVQLQGGPVIRAEDLPAYLNGSGPVIGDRAQMEKDAAAKEFVANNPINLNVDTSAPSGERLYSQPEYNTALYAKTPELDTLYDRFKRRQYAEGGQINPPDDQTGMMNTSPVDGLAMGGMNYAAGGTARFLSGGGDGMSDSIPATIEGKQEARLADGEFIISSDVVSGLGNGSSKAGAKQLYAMMDRVRKARTGNPKQGKQINPRKYLAA
jgi:hypothetical protein